MHTFTFPGVVNTAAVAEKINDLGNPVETGDEVVISKLYSSRVSSNGLITFSPIAEKAKSNTLGYDLVRVSEEYSPSSV